MPVNDTWERRQAKIEASRDRIASGGCAIVLAFTAGAVGGILWAVIEGVKAVLS